MADPLKTFFDRARVVAIGKPLAAAWPAFPQARFVREAVAGLDPLALTDRGRHIAAAMTRALPASYPEALAIILASLGERLARTEGNGLAPFHYLPHVVFVAEHGLADADVDRSLEAQHALTRRFSCEFSIRPFLERHPARTLAALTRWTTDPDEHVRRLVSEGTRPRLPWAARLRGFQRDPTPVLALLERLKDDPSSYVSEGSPEHDGAVMPPRGMHASLQPVPRLSRGNRN